LEVGRFTVWAWLKKGSPDLYTRAWKTVFWPSWASDSGNEVSILVCASCHCSRAIVCIGLVGVLNLHRMAAKVVTLIIKIQGNRAAVWYV